MAEASAIRLRIESDRLAGDSGCNSFGGSYQFSGETLTIGPIASSKRGCPGPRAAVETALFTALSSVTTARLEGEHLLLITKAGQGLRFAPSDAIDE
jgi:heat shock protein HslJ